MLFRSLAEKLDELDLAQYLDRFLDQGLIHGILFLI